MYDIDRLISRSLKTNYGLSTKTDWLTVLGGLDLGCHGIVFLLICPLSRMYGLRIRHCW